MTPERTSIRSNSGQECKIDPFAVELGQLALIDDLFHFDRFGPTISRVALPVLFAHWIIFFRRIPSKTI